MNDFSLVLPDGLSADLLITYIVGAGTFVGVMIIYRVMKIRHVRIDRMETLRRYRTNIHIDAPLPRYRRLIGDGAPANVLKIWIRYARSLRSHQMHGLRSRLSRAGHRSKEAVAIYVCCKLLLPMALMITSSFILYIVFPLIMPAVYRPAAVVVMVLIGFFGPDVVVFNTASKRRLALLKGVPDGLDLLVICAEAGLSLDSALHRVAEEIARSSPELADELGITSVELRIPTMSAGHSERKSATCSDLSRPAVPIDVGRGGGSPAGRW
jgi:tight adherence protein C